MKKKTSIIFLYVLLCSYSYGQMDHYSYYRQLSNITDQWHKVDLPDDVFEKISPDFSDIRIFGITETNDTIEAPYILNIITEKISQKEVVFKTINESFKEAGYYYTFEVPTKESVNQINLKFGQLNFDWDVTLSGSQDRKEWFTILKNYRILSIKNDQTDYQFTKLIFPDSKYNYYQIQINSRENPELISAQVSLVETTMANFRNYTINAIKTTENKQLMKTEIVISLTFPVSVSYLQINIPDTFDFYRPVKVQYLFDSTETPKGWKYNFRTLMSGTLSSVEKNEFKFSSTILQQLKIVIDNDNNKPLTVENIKVRGYVYELLASITEHASYYLVYGNGWAKKPKYDIERFVDKIPDVITFMNLGEEQIIQKEEKLIKEPLFKDKSWLWAVMVIIILLLGWFTLKMLKKNNTKSQ